MAARNPEGTLRVATSTLRKVVAGLDRAFVRRHPWLIHFFNETVDHRDVSALMHFLAARKPLRDGEYLGQYEEMFRDAIDPAGRVFSFGSARMALYALLEAMDIGRGDEVIVPAFTCEVVIHAILYRGSRPVYADIEPVTFNMDVAKLPRLVTRRTKAILAQHTFGVPCDLDGIRAVVGASRIKIIEDCALALGSRYRGRPVGCHGDAAIYSTDRTKMLSTVSGGVAFTRDPDLARRLRDIHHRAPFLSHTALANMSMQLLGGSVCFWPYLYPIGWAAMAVGHTSGLLFRLPEDKVRFVTPVNYPCRFSNVQAWLGIHQLEKLQTVLSRRQTSVRRYREILAGRGIANGDTSDFTLRFPLLLRDRRRFIRRWNRYFEVGTWFDGPAFGWTGDLSTIGYQMGSCPVAEFVHSRIVNFPTHQTRERLERYLCEIVDSIRPEDVATYSD
jgi:perosamine synthetase